MLKTLFRSLAQEMRFGSLVDLSEAAPSAIAIDGAGVGILGITSFLCLSWGPSTPWYLVRWIRGRGTRAASFSISSMGDILMAAVPSSHGFLNL